MESSLRRLAENLWVIDHPLRLRGLDIGTRTSVVRLRDGGLFVHSPGPLSDSLRGELDSTGSVRCIVAPSAIHHFWVAENSRAFPEALVYGAPGVARKLEGVCLHEELRDEPAEPWAGVIDQVPVEGAPYLSEFAFLHRESRTLLLTDLCFNIAKSDSWPTRLFLRAVNAYGRFGPSRIARACMRDRRAVRASVDRILRWDFDRVVVTHGDVLETGGHAAFEQAFAFLKA